MHLEIHEAVQPDGKILQAVPVIIAGTYQASVIRYKINGEPDSSFGIAGRFTSAFNTGTRPMDIALQSNGKIIIAGNQIDPNTSLNCFMAMRLNSNGTLDASFGNNGRTIFSFIASENCGANAVAIQPDGKIVLGGHTWEQVMQSYSIWTLARLNTNGSLDSSFDIDGRQITPIDGNDFIWDMAIQTDGKIVAVGTVHKSLVQGMPPKTEVAVARYNSDGAPDQTFGVQGKFIWPENNVWPFATALALQSDGKIVAGASYHNGSDYDFMIVRLKTNGVPDSSFGNAGRVNTGIGTVDDMLYSVAIQQDGKIVAAGETLNPLPSHNNTAVVRYTSAGVLDNSFGVSGKTVVDMNSGSDDRFGLIASQGSKIIVSIGTTNAGQYNVPALVRLINSSGFYYPFDCSIPPAAPTITIAGNQLTSSSPVNNQWYLNNIAIPGATNQIYIATSSGSYTVKVSVANCSSAASNAISYNVTSVPPGFLPGSVLIGPNPVLHSLVISSTGISKLWVEVFDISGRCVIKKQGFFSRYELDFSSYAKGSYIIKVLNERTGETIKKIVAHQ